jgi:hypothetical protein
METLLTVLLVWIGSHTSYDVSRVTLPQVEYHTKAELQDIYYGDCKRDVHRVIIAVYNEVKGGTIYLNKTVNFRKEDDISVVVHELFHHVQHLNSEKMPQDKEGREKETIAVENLWRNEHHLPKRVFTPSQAIYTCAN